jgi:hypothetical protein
LIRGRSLPPYPSVDGDYSITGYAKRRNLYFSDIPAGFIFADAQE